MSVRTLEVPHRYGKEGKEAAEKLADRRTGASSEIVEDKVRDVVCTPNACILAGYSRLQRFPTQAATRHLVFAEQYAGT